MKIQIGCLVVAKSEVKNNKPILYKVVDIDIKAAKASIIEVGALDFIPKLTVFISAIRLAEPEELV